jgi:hypothetical protein
MLALAIVIALRVVSFRQKELTERCAMAAPAVYRSRLTEFPPRPGTLTRGRRDRDQDRRRGSTGERVAMDAQPARQRALARALRQVMPE